MTSYLWSVDVLQPRRTDAIVGRSRNSTLSGTEVGVGAELPADGTALAAARTLVVSLSSLLALSSSCEHHQGPVLPARPSGSSQIVGSPVGDR